jgi:hypothetical protein
VANLNRFIAAHFDICQRIHKDRCICQLYCSTGVVIWRKLSFGTQSAAGSHFVEAMLTVNKTCRQQSRNAFALLANAVEAHLAHKPVPKLLNGVRTVTFVIGRADDRAEYKFHCFRRIH